MIDSRYWSFYKVKQCVTDLDHSTYTKLYNKVDVMTSVYYIGNIKIQIEKEILKITFSLLISYPKIYLYKMFVNMSFFNIVSGLKSKYFYITNMKMIFFDLRWSMLIEHFAVCS